MTKEIQLTSNFSESIPSLSQDKRALLALLLQQKGNEFNSFPLSFAQQRLWFLDQMEPGNASYNIPVARRITGALDVNALEQSLSEIVRRHESLRTSFRVIDGQPVQVIAPHQPLKLQVTDLATLAEGEKEAAADRIVMTEGQRTFDLSESPLMRVSLIRLGEREHVLLITMHHIISDGWSVSLFFRELSILYNSFSDGNPSPLPELKVQYADYAVWQREQLSGEVLERQLSYWKEQLADAPAVLELPTDRPRPAVQSYRGATRSISLPAEAVQALKRLSREEGVTLFMTFLAAFQVLLSRYSGEEDIVVGVPIAGRQRAEVEPLIGFFINTLALRIDLSGNPSFREVLRRVKEVALGAYAHQDMPFEKLVEELRPERNLSHQPLFQVMFQLQNQGRGEIALEGLRVEGFRKQGHTAKYDLFLSITEKPQRITIGLEYNEDLFDASTVARMLQHLQLLLEGISADPLQPVTLLPLLSKAERHLALTEWNQTSAPYPDETTIDQLFEVQAQRTPHAVAVYFEDQLITYQQLNERANQLARHLLSRTSRAEPLIGILMHRSIDMVVSLLAVLKAGGAYVPLDPQYPRERLSFMLADAGVDVLLTQEQLIGQVLENLGEQHARVVAVDKERSRIDEQRVENLSTGKVGGGENLAYIIYTSGSTGRPKGVLGLHKGAINRFGWMWDAYPFMVDEVCCQKTSLSFVDAVWEIWGPLLRGVATVIIPDQVLKDPEQLVQALAAQQVTRIVLVPSLLRVIMESHSNLQSRLPKLKYWVASGEALPLDLYQRFRQRMPAGALINLYGSSEVSADATCYDTSRNEPLTCIPIGHPIANMRAYVLDERQQPVPVGVAGELYVGGEGLARGYHARPDLTAEKFVPDALSGERGARLYRTGDRARLLSDGQIEYLSRADYQVKLRGYRIELGEIEVALREQADVREAVAVVKGESEKQLVAYVVSKSGAALKSSELRERLRERLPQYMMPAAIVQLEKMPLTANGKVDRRKLPSPTQAQSLTEQFTAPQTPIQELLCSLWSELLHVESVGIHDNFFELGGHSLLATRLMSRLSEVFAREVPLRYLFDQPTVAALAEKMAATGGVLRPALPLRRVSREQALPLSFAQQRLWFLDQMQPGHSFYNIPAARRLTGALDVTALQHSLSEIVRRHESLRTSFRIVDGQPTQLISEPQPVELTVTDLTHLSAPEEREQAAAQAAQAETQRGFDLTRSPLLRVRLIKLSEEEHILLLTLHHIISDGWSMGLLFRELTTLYNAYVRGAASPLRELSIQYAEYAVWQREYLKEEVLDEQLTYWREQLRGAPALLELPTDHPRPAVQSYRGAISSFTLPEELSRKLKALSQRAGVTLFMTLLAAFEVLLSRYSGQEDIVIGTPIAGRSRQETEGLIGLFVNTLAMRADLRGRPTFLELLKRTRELCLAGYTHQDAPFEKLVEEMQPERSMSHSPLFQVMFQLLNAQRNAAPLEGLSSQAVNLKQDATKFDLTLSVVDAGQNILGVVEYNTDLYEAETIRRMIDHYLQLLESSVSNPHQQVVKLPLLREPERRQLLYEWNETARDYPRQQCIHQLFEEQAERTPEAVALIFEDEQFTYRELNERANQLSHYLLKQGVGAESVVGVFMERSIALVVSLLAILKAGAAYLPLDPDYPMERLRLMLEDSAAALVLTQQAIARQVSGCRQRLFCIDQQWGQVSGHSAENPQVEIWPEQLAYVIYTSGSTGQPKAAMNTHGAIANRLLWMQEAYGLDQSDSVLQKTPFSFDVSVWEFFWPLMTGARLVMARPGGHRDPYYLADVIRKEEVTTLHFVPSMLELFLAGANLKGFPKLRQVICSGEALGAELVQHFFERLPDVRLYNLYGPTETAVDVSHWECRNESAPRRVPIGKPIANTQLYVLDEQQDIAGVGISGELYIGGANVGRGYWKRPELTAEKFVPDPFSPLPGRRLYRTGDLARYLADGDIEFLGRRDHQVKLRGFRIELGEIEAALCGHEQIREAVVVACRREGADKRLVAYLVADTQANPSSSQLRSYLKERLPEYMVPSAFVMLEGLPLTVSGKVDRRALPEPDDTQEGGQEQYVEPQTAVEELLAGIWSEVLRVERVGIHDNFFELGGHSLLATRVITRIRELFGVELLLRSLFEAPTIVEFSRKVEEARAGEERVAVPAITPARREEPLPLSFAQQRLWFLDQMQPGHSFYNIPAARRLTGALDVTALQHSLSEIVRRHESLRTSFRIVDGQPTQLISDPQPVELTVTDLSQLSVQEERETAAAQAAQAETQRGFDLTRSPLLRVRLVKLSEEEHILLLTLHHIISDGWSMGLLFRELTTLYNAYVRGAASPLRELSIQYADYAVWQRAYLKEEVLDEQLTYWREQLRGAPALLELPTDHPRPAVQSYRGAIKTFSLPPELSSKLKMLSQRAGVTLFMTLLAAFEVLLSRYSGQEDIVIGTPIAGRSRQETEGLIGLFVNTLAMRADLRGRPTFLELLKRTRELCLAGYTHQDAPFEKLVEEMQPERSMSHSPLFQVMFQLLNAQRDVLTLDGLQCSGLRYERGETAKSDLRLVMSETAQGLSGAIEYSTELFERETVERLIGHYRTLLESMVADPQQPISELALLSQAEREQLLVEWNDTTTEFPRDTCIHQLFEQQVERRPEAVAIVRGTDTLTYCELNERSNQLSHYLIRQGIGAESLVGVLMERSVEMIVSLLAVLKAGAAYLPLDPSYPPERLRLMLQDSNARVLLTEERLVGTAGETTARVVCVDAEREQIKQESVANPRVRQLMNSARAQHLAYVIYTSGSTAMPKGILISHRAVVRLVCNTNYITVLSSDRIAQASNCCFDAATFEIWGALLHGALLVIIGTEVLLSPTALAAQLKAQGITILFLTTALFNQLAREAPHAFSHLRHLMFGGEAVDPRPVAEVLLGGGAPERLLHVYGPTESTTFATWQLVEEVAEKERTIPIGKPLSNTRAYILDERLEAVPVGVAGELHLGGDGLAYGYLNRPDLTAEKFIPHPYAESVGERLYKTGDWARYGADGAIEFIGRRDYQVKVRGFRIELGEIEAALCSHHLVREAVVIAIEHDSGDKRLIAYVVVAGQAELKSAELRRYLKERLPDYMLPSAFVFLESLPLSLNGKVDRRKLPSPTQAQSLTEQFTAPQTPTQELLCSLWSEVLHVERVGIHDNFFELGGHSLLATRLMSRLSEVFAREVPLRYLFDQPTVAALAERVESAEGEGISSLPLRRVSREQALPLSYSQQRLWLFDQMQPGHSFYNITTGRRLQGQLEVTALQLSLSEIVRRHESLRTSFQIVDSQPVQVISEPQPVEIAVTDLSPLSVEEREARAGEQAKAEAERGFDLSRGPLVRVRLIKLSAEEHILLFTLHHIVSDGWSMGLLFRELTTLYNAYLRGAASPLGELSIQYADYAVWQRAYLKEEVLDEQLTYWREQLRGAPALLELPTDHPRPAVQSYRGAYQSLTISRELMEQLKQLSRQEGATLFMTLLAAFQILLAHYSRQEDIVVGTNVAGRNRAELEELIGFFINTLVIRTDLSGDPTLSEALRRVRKVCLEAHAHQDVPFEKFVEAIKPKRNPGYSPLFQVKIDLLKNARMSLNFSNIKSSVFGYEGENSRYDMFLVLAESENGLRGAWNYNPDLFDRTTIERLAQSFIMVLESLVTSPETHINALGSFAATGKEGKNGEKKLTSSGFKKLKGTQLKAIKILRQSLVKAESLNQGQSLPLLVRPAVEMLDLSAWAANNRDLIATQLREHGAIIFRDFSIESITKFEQFIKTVSGELLQYQDGSSPRSRITGNIYSSTDHPASQPIFLHNENSYSYSWPLKLFFYCVTPASQGGETPIADSRRISRRINPRIKELFMKKSVMYVRNFGNGFGLPWQTVFQTDDKTALESYCKSVGIEARWKGPNHLQTRQVRPALAKHPDTGELLWFNHAVFFHITTLEQSLRESLLSGFAEEDLPYNTYYGDGTPIEPDVLDELRDIYRQETVLFPWQRSDVLMIDNMLAAHGRQPYVGARQIVVGMAEPFHS